MWQYNDFSKMTTRRNESELYHSDTYLGVEFSDGIRHWKYIKKEKMSNGKFRYYYKNDNLDQLDKERSESFNKAMKESTKYSTVGTRYNYGSNKDTVHYQVERKDYSEEKANAAWKEYKKKSNKWAAAKVADIPRRIIGKGMAWVANLFKDKGGFKMELSIGSRFKNAYNAFTNKNPTSNDNGYNGYYHRPDRVRLTTRNERSIITSVFNRIAIDVAAIDINHCQLDKDGRFQSIISSSLNECLSVEANLDQTGRNLIQDVVMSMFDEGCVAIVPVDTTFNPNDTNSYDILSLRVGKIVTWYPNQVMVEVYNERKGLKEEILLNKSDVAIIENPLYAIMNEPNSTLQRLIRKLVLLDSIDEQSGSGKLDLIIQLPYIVKSPARRAQAEQRRVDIEKQLSGSKYGIAYTDGTEKITQLNRPVENNLMKQIEYLTSMLYSQLGITQAVLDGTADEKTMLNYYSRTVEPIISSIVDEMIRKFITKTSRTQGKTILFFRDPFKLVPVNQIAEIADKFTRNEILTSNEIRQVIGRKPSDDPKADMLINSNLNQSTESIADMNGNNQNKTEGGTNIE